MDLIVAIESNWGIGKNNRIPWHIPEDLAYFREMTMGSILVMGRRTFESLPGGVPLSGRTHIVLTRDSEFCPVGVTRAEGLPQLFLHLRKMSPARVFIAGGASIYQQLLPYCSRSYVTRIHASFDTDVRFADLDHDPEWKLDRVHHTIRSVSGYLFTVHEYVRLFR